MTDFDERDLDARAARLRDAAGPARFSPGFEQRVMRGIAVDKRDAREGSVAAMLSSYFRWYLAPAAVAASLVLATINIRSANAPRLIDRLMGVEEQQAVQVESLYALYVN